MSPATKNPNVSELVSQMRSANKQMTTLSDHVTGLTSAVALLTQRVQRSRIVLTIVVIGFILDIALTVALSLVAVQQRNNTSQIHDVQEKTSQQVLCPLYQIFLDARSPQARATYPQGPAAYDLAYSQIQHGYDVLECHRS